MREYLHRFLFDELHCQGIYEGQGTLEQLQALETVQRWALDPLIRRTNNIVILLTAHIEQLANSVYSEGSGSRAIRIPLPSLDEREAFIDYMMSKAGLKLFTLDPTDFGENAREQVRRFARMTQGMRLIDIDNLNRRTIIEYHTRKKHNLDKSFEKMLNLDMGFEMMRASDVQRAKAEAIMAQSVQLFELIQPTQGFQEIAGLEHLKQYLLGCVSLMREGRRSLLVPSRLLLVGPPGTNKAIIAEAIASPRVAQRDVRCNQPA